MKEEELSFPLQLLRRIEPLYRRIKERPEYKRYYLEYRCSDSQHHFSVQDGLSNGKYFCAIYYEDTKIIQVLGCQSGTALPKTIDDVVQSLERLFFN